MLTSRRSGIFLSLLVIFSLVLTSCGGANTGNSTQEVPVTGETMPALETPAGGDLGAATATPAAEMEATEPPAADMEEHLQRRWKRHPLKRLKWRRPPRQ